MGHNDCTNSLRDGRRSSSTLPTAGGNMSGQSRETPFPDQASYSTDRETRDGRADLATRATQASENAAGAALDGIDEARLKVQSGFEQQRGRAAHAIQRVSHAF